MAILPASITSNLIQVYASNIMKDGTAQTIVVPLFDSNGEQYTGTITNLGVIFILNGGSDVTLSTTCTYSATAGGHKLIIPSADITAHGKYSACVTGDEIGTVLLDGLVVPSISLEAINAEVDTAISDAGLVTKIDTVDTVVDGIATTLATPDNFKADISNLATSAEITALSNVAAVGAERVIPATYITFDASAKTITLASPYNTITVEQVLSIRNLTKNMLLYDCTMTNRSSISIDAGVITHTYSGTMADTDKLMIIVNMA